jgi:hypothetical protein
MPRSAEMRQEIPTSPQPRPAGPADKLIRKLAPSLVEAATRGGPEKVRVQIMLTDTSAAALAQLKKLGFEVISEPKTGRIVTGRIAASQLAKVAELAFVRYVSPL